MATIFDVAKYILERQGETTTLKLQKLCYYAQAWNLVWEEKPMFKENFEAWANGPVCPKLYEIHRGKFTITANDLPMGDVSNLTEEEKQNIDEVLDFYGDKAPHWLSELTHQERPWKETRELSGVGRGERCSSVIDKRLMQDYYTGL